MGDPLPMSTGSGLRHKLLARYEYYRHPEMLDYWGGPFNGQCFRQLMYLDLALACNFEAIVETGTFRGSTTRFLAQNSGGSPVYSCEYGPLNFEFAKWRLRADQYVALFNLDSRQFIRQLEIPAQARTFFYLDAHWGEDLPLSEELESIFQKFNNFVVMVDDFEVPGDPGYKFDDYGPGKRLSLRDFPLHRDGRIACYFPARPSSQESGLKRGAIILASLGLKDKLDCLRSVIPAIGKLS
jgi:predicted O-methyltransferase YrrM